MKVGQGRRLHWGRTAPSRGTDKGLEREESERQDRSFGAPPWVRLSPFYLRRWQTVPEDWEKDADPISDRPKALRLLYPPRRSRRAPPAGPVCLQRNAADGSFQARGPLLKKSSTTHASLRRSRSVIDRAAVASWKHEVGRSSLGQSKIPATEQDHDSQSSHR